MARSADDMVMVRIAMQLVVLHAFQIDDGVNEVKRRQDIEGAVNGHFIETLGRADDVAYRKNAGMSFENAGYLLAGSGFFVPFFD